jgi:hypothetical protein
MADIGASTVSWLDMNDDWQTHPPSPAPFAEMGKGYVLEAPSDLRYVFTGEPAAMIMHVDGYEWDFPEDSQVVASVVGNDTRLIWPDLGPGIEYNVYFSSTRDGFFIGSYNVLNGGAPVIGTTYTDVDAVFMLGELYYMVVPKNSSTSEIGSSTYSVGVITTEFNGNEMFGLPLKPLWGDRSADWYVDQIPNALGIVYLDEGLWKAHFKEFPENVYDVIIECGKGYELTTNVTSRYSFIGL